MTGAESPAGLSSDVREDLRGVLEEGLSGSGYATGTDAFGVKTPRQLIRQMQALNAAGEPDVSLDAKSHLNLGRVLMEAMKENVSLESPCDIDLDVAEGDTQGDINDEIFRSTTSAGDVSVTETISAEVEVVSEGVLGLSLRQSYIIEGTDRYGLRSRNTIRSAPKRLSLSATGIAVEYNSDEEDRHHAVESSVSALSASVIENNSDVDATFAVEAAAPSASSSSSSTDVESEPDTAPPATPSSLTGEVVSTIRDILAPGTSGNRMNPDTTLDLPLTPTAPAPTG